MAQEHVLQMLAKPLMGLTKLASAVMACAA